MKIAKEEFLARHAALYAKMEEAGLDALIVGASAQIEQRGALRWLLDYYLSVYEESLVMAPGREPVFFAHDGTAVVQLETCPITPEIRVTPATTYLEDEAAPVADYLNAIRARRVGFACMAGISARYLASLQRHFDGEIVDFTLPLDQLRMVKSPAEIAMTLETVKLNEDSLWEFVRHVRPYASEGDALAAGYAFAAKAGAEDQYWMSGSGVPAIALHAVPARRRNYRFKSEDYTVLAVEHAIPGGHYGETWNLIRIGAKDPELEAAQAAVVESLQAAAEMIRPGNTVGQVAEAAEKSLIASGWLTPRPAGAPVSPIGHGQGLDAWEYPSVNAACTQVIVPNMRFNLHPAIQMSNGTKVSFCDCYLSTEGSCRRLTTLPYDVLYV